MRFLIFSFILIIVHSAPSKEKMELAHKDPHDYKIDANDQHSGSNHELASIDGHVHNSHGHDNPGGSIKKREADNQINDLESSRAHCCISTDKQKRYRFLVPCYPVELKTKCERYPYFVYQEPSIVLSEIECCIDDQIYEKLKDLMPKCIMAKQCYTPYAQVL